MVILMSAVQLSFTDQLILNLFVDDSRSEMALDDLALSLILGGGLSAIYALAGIPLGRAADRYNRRNIIVLGRIIWSVGTMACGVATSFTDLFWARDEVGLGEATLLPAAVSLIADSFPSEQRGRTLGLFILGGVIGSGLAFLTGGILIDWLGRGGLDTVPLIGAWPGWRRIMILAGLPGLPLAIMTVTLVGEPSRKGATEGVPTFAMVLRGVRSNSARVLRICRATGLVAAGDYGIMAWLLALMVRSDTLLSLQRHFRYWRRATTSNLVGACGGRHGCRAGEQVPSLRIYRRRTAHLYRAEPFRSGAKIAGKKALVEAQRLRRCRALTARSLGKSR